MTKIVSQNEVPSKRVGEGLVKIQHLQQSISLDRVKIAISQSSNIGSALSHGRVCPEAVPEHVTLTENGDHFVVLDYLEASSHDETQRIDRLARMIQQITWCAMGHREMHRQGAKTTVRGQSRINN